MDLGAPPRPKRRIRAEAPVLAAVAVGGALGASARYGAALLWPTPPGAFPWTTCLVNVIGCGAMGVLMVLVTEVLTGYRLLRPFLGTGVLGGYTTFSTYAADIHHLVGIGRAATGLAYLATTLFAALGATWLTSALTRGAIGLTRRRTR